MSTTTTASGRHVSVEEQNRVIKEAAAAVIKATRLGIDGGDLFKLLFWAHTSTQLSPAELEQAQGLLNPRGASRAYISISEMYHISREAIKMVAPHLIEKEK